jgi:phytoene desaturase
MNRRIAIIGAGPGGLATAMLLARTGAEVTVFERSGNVGGRSAGIDAQSLAGRFRFDMGPTFFLYPRVLEEIFAACGRNMHREIDLIRLDPQYDLMFEAGGHIRATPDLAELQAQVARLSPEDAAALPRFMADNRAKLHAFRPVLEAAFHGWRDLIRPDMLKALPIMRPWRSVDSDLATYFKDERVRLAFSFQSKYLGMSPYRCPSLFTILSFLEYEFGVYHPRGGCGAVMDALARVASDMGVNFRLGEPVQEILFSASRANGVRTASGDTAADAVVVNADFAHAMQTLVPNRLRRRWTDRKLAKKKFSCSTFMLYLGLEGIEEKLAHHTIYLSANYKRNIAEIEAGMVPPKDPSFYVQNACVTDPGLAPAGYSTLYVLVPVGNRSKAGIDWPTEQAKFRAAAIDGLEKLGIKHLEKRIVFEKVCTPQNWEDEHAIHRGATFNLSHSLDQMLCFRPCNRFEDLDRVYLVGGGTHPGSGLPVIFESARITSRLLAEDLGLSLHWEQDAPMEAAGLTPVMAEAL